MIIGLAIVHEDDDDDDEYYEDYEDYEQTYLVLMHYANTYWSSLKVHGIDKHNSSIVI